eukprot:scaffold37880_cov70-Phaeocystis_antarctica.AAC.4
MPRQVDDQRGWEGGGGGRGWEGGGGSGATAARALLRRLLQLCCRHLLQPLRAAEIQVVRVRLCALRQCHAAASQHRLQLSRRQVSRSWHVALTVSGVHCDVVRRARE